MIGRPFIYSTQKYFQKSIKIDKNLNLKSVCFKTEQIYEHQCDLACVEKKDFIIFQQKF